VLYFHVVAPWTFSVSNYRLPVFPDYQVVHLTSVSNVTTWLPVSALWIFSCFSRLTVSCYRFARSFTDVVQALARGRPQFILVTAVLGRFV